jgi:flagellar biosynthetic protein FlhB
MSDESSSEDKTEDPTQRRLEDARKKGQIPQSKEVGNFFMIGAFTLICAMMFPMLFEAAKNSLAKYITSSHDFLFRDDSFMEIGYMMAIDIAKILAIPLGFLFVAAAIGPLSQNGFHASASSIQPKFEKISLIKGAKRMFSRRSFVEFLKGIIKISIVGYICYSEVKGELGAISKVIHMDMTELLTYLSGLCLKILVGACIALFFIAIIDFMYQKFEFLKSMRMTKQEIKDEYKQQEGDPHIKGKLKQIRMEKARSRMMAAVPKADVVITNPIHFAVALVYDQEKGQAPVVVAKGTDKVAERIKELANENKISIVRNPTLARQLFADCELEQEIPFQHFQAVAEVISYVYKLKGKK